MLPTTILPPNPNRQPPRPKPTQALSLPRSNDCDLFTINRGVRTSVKSTTTVSSIADTATLSTPIDAPPPAAKRVRAPSKRLADMTNQELEAQAARLTAKERKHRQEEDRRQQEESEETFDRENHRDHLHGE
jgi:hypothetical protein